MQLKKLVSLAGAMTVAMASTVILVATNASGAAPAQERSANRKLPASLSALKLNAPVTRTGVGAERLHPRLLQAKGANKVIIRLRSPAVAHQGLVDDATVQARNVLRQ